MDFAQGMNYSQPTENTILQKSFQKSQNVYLITGSRGSIALGRCRVPTHSCRLSFQSINAAFNNKLLSDHKFTTQEKNDLAIQGMH